MSRECCPNCGDFDSVVDYDLTHQMQYGVDEQVTLVVGMRGLNCKSCGLIFSSAEGEDAVTEAIERYRRVLWGVGPAKT